MYARLISFSGADPEKRERAIHTLQETVIPTLREYEGFAGYLGLYDQDSRRAKALILWKSKEAADAAEETLGERRVQMASGVGLTIESVELYEAPSSSCKAPSRSSPRSTVSLRSGTGPPGCATGRRALGRCSVKARGGSAEDNH